MNKKALFSMLTVFVFVLSACGGNANSEEEADVGDANANGENQENVESGSEEEPDSDSNSLEEPDDLVLLNNQNPPPGADSQFDTDFSISIISFEEVLSGGPPKDGIPAVDNPKFVSIAKADEWLEDLEPVVAVMHNGETRAYPIQILMWHEIVNDVLGGDPVSVTFCPLCNTAIVFSGLLGNYEFDFGTTGRLRYSNLIMYDRQTETWWQQATGEAIVGELTGQQLTFLPAAIISWEQFKESYPNTEVLSQDTGYSRRYGTNPYLGYDKSNPFLYRGPITPNELHATARVLTLDFNGEAVAYPYEVMRQLGVVNDTVGGVDAAIFWQTGVASALSSSDIASGDDIGTVAAFSPVIEGQTLTFVFEDGEIVDEQTESVWNVLGEAVSGELVGSVLVQVVSINHFWFSWAAFRPDTTIYTGN